MKTLLYEVILRDPITKAIYPEEFVGLRSIVGVTPGGRFEIEVRVNFEAIPSKNDLLPQTVEIEVTVNGQANPWVFDCTAQIPVCTFVGFPDSHGQVTPYVVPATLPTLVPGDSTHGQDDDQEWVDELFTVQVNATVIYSYVETTNVHDDPIPSDFFTFPAQTLYYHSPGTMTTLSSHYTKQNRSSAKTLDHALTAAISAAAYDDFYADNYDPNDDSDNDDIDGNNDDDDGDDYDSDDDSEVYEVDVHGNRKHNRHHSNGDDDDDSANEDDWWGADAQPQATKAIQQQKDRHQQLVQQHQRRQTPAGAGVGSSSSSSGAAAVVAGVTAIASTVAAAAAAKRGYGAISHDSSDSEGGGGLPPAKRATSTASVISSLPVLTVPALAPAPTAPVLPTITSSFSHRLPMADSDSEAD